jgi:uncharacterized protein
MRIPSITSLQMIDYTTHLRNAKTIAIVGCSGRTNRTSHTIARYLLSNGFEVVPVNPHYDEILGRTCYPDLQSVPDELVLDIVNIFRNERFAADMVQMAADYAADRGRKPVVWTQIGVSSPEAEEIAASHGLPYVRNRCIMIEHRLAVGHVTG